MSILDEDKSNFVGDSDDRDISIMYSAANILKCSIDKVLRITCSSESCRGCIGRKYNIKNGCPICGSTMYETISVQRATIRPVYKCITCKSLAIGCGGGDVMTIGIATDAAEIMDSII